MDLNRLYILSNRDEYYYYYYYDIAEVAGTINLRLVFYAMNILDGNPLIAEIHQADPMMNVDVVVGKTEEAVACMDMFNKILRHTSRTTS